MSLYKRRYENYKHYVDHQKEKLDRELDSIRRRTEGAIVKFLVRFEMFSDKIHGKKVLCLGARLGEEVQAFIGLGHTESIGIDLNPGPDNEYVVKGDFHKMLFEGNQFDAVYCNSLDHARDLGKISRESARVLKSNGILILDVPFVRKDRRYNYEKNIIRWKLLKKENKYESLLWDTLDDVLIEFKEFTEIHKRIFSKKSNRVIVFLEKIKLSK